jgi:hypothetical protein
VNTRAAQPAHARTTGSAATTPPTVSTKSITSPSQAATGITGAGCAGCGAPLAAQQRYCLECGERSAPISDFLLGRPSSAQDAATITAPSAPSQPQPPRTAHTEGAAQRGNTLLVIAGVGVLMLAMGVGVLIGRSGQAKQAPAQAPEVITVAGAGSPTSTTPSEASFSSDWPAGTNGYTVQLQTLPRSSTLSAVEAAKTAAAGKGAKAVGALKSEEFTSLTSGTYVIYAGVDHSKSAAQKALASLKKSFPAAKVISVSNSSSSQTGSSASSAPGSSETHPAPASVLQSESKAKGKNYEEKSKNLPDVVETG